MAVPEFPNDRSLLSMINIYAGEKAHDGAKDFLARMGLPNAEEGEFFLGPNVARLYLPEGLSVSFVFRNVNVLAAAWSWALPSRAVEPARVYAARKIVDPEILQPLYQEDLCEKCCVEIVPGIPRAKITNKDTLEITASLASRKIDFYNAEGEFVGIIRDDNGHEQRLVTNRRAVRIMKGHVLNAGEAGLQDALFGSLRHEFKSAHDSGSAHILQKFLAHCKDPELPLFPYWSKMQPVSPRTKDIADTAQNYAMKLAAS